MQIKLNEKLKRIVEAAGKLEPGVVHIKVKHDDECPAKVSGNLSDCICEPVIKRMGEC
ncbi:MAG TPA: hypothetical protein PLP18_06895 [Smithellaceae bacterium]|nr:hypothetical protein [Smithellaceae bacterium]